MSSLFLNANEFVLQSGPAVIHHPVVPFQSRSVVTAFDHDWSLSQLPRLPANLPTARESLLALLHSDSSSTSVWPSHRLAPNALLVRASRSTGALARRQPSDSRRPRPRTFVAPHALHTVPVQVVIPTAGVALQCFLRPAPSLELPLQVAPGRSLQETQRLLPHLHAALSCSGRYADRRQCNHVDRYKRGSAFLSMRDFGSTSCVHRRRNKRSPATTPILHAPLPCSSLDSNSAGVGCGSSRIPPN